jgi:hypothetical protein
VEPKTAKKSWPSRGNCKYQKSKKKITVQKKGNFRKIFLQQKKISPRRKTEKITL